jgi:transcription termination factor Rho
MDYSKMSREELDDLSLFELRNAAREMGVKSPTTYNKGDLIDKMISISSGEVKPVKSNRGRPPKILVGLKSEEEKAAEVRQAAPPAVEVPREPKVRVYVNPEFAEGNRFREVKEFQQRESRPRENYQNNNYHNNGNNYQNNNNNNYQSNNNYQNNNYQNQKRNNFKSVAERSRPAQELNEIDPNATYESREGILEILPDGYGFLRSDNCENSLKDAYISAMKIKKFGLRKGDYVKGLVLTQLDAKVPAMAVIETVNDREPEECLNRPNFDDLTPIYPDARYKLENPDSSREFAIRSIDLIAPIGKGQRAMIVSPPKAGKTTLLKQIAHSVSRNYPEAKLIVLLIGERPEEVTDMKRSIQGEVIYSTFDEMPDHHTRAAEMVLNHAKRLVEMGHDVVLLLDSLTRLARAYNMTIPPTGRSLSGGLDPGALHSPKRFFGAARNIEHGGSLTIIATALVDTGSRMDDVIYEEFKGTGNMEIHLDRRLSEKRIFPAIDLAKSGTRREDLLLTQKELEGIWSVRRILSSGDTVEAAEYIIGLMMKTKNNEELIEQLNLQLAVLRKNGYKFR